jgi:hypothetical protein
MNLDILKKILAICCLHIINPAIAGEFSTKQQVLESYANELSYLDSKVFLYEIDLNQDGFSELLLSTDDELYAVGRFGHKQFTIVTRFPSVKEQYLPGHSVVMKDLDYIGKFFTGNQLYLQAIGIDGSFSYYWLDNEYKFHTTEDKLLENLSVESVARLEKDFKRDYQIRRFLKKTYSVEGVISESAKKNKQTYADSVDSKLFISGSSYMTLEGEKRSRKFEWVKDDERVYLGDYIGNKRVFYPASEAVAEKFYKVIIQRKSSLKKMKNGTVRWNYKPTLAPEWATAHPEVSEKLKLLSESCLPREVCEPIDSLDEAPSTNGNKKPLANDAGNANNSPAVTKEDSNEAPVIEGNKQESQWPQAIVWICVFIGFVFVAGMYIRSRRIKKIK